jgi:hypothetical protein
MKATTAWTAPSSKPLKTKIPTNSPLSWTAGVHPGKQIRPPFQLRRAVSAHCAQPVARQSQSWKSQVFKDVDTGEKVQIGMIYGDVSVPKNWGMLNLAITAMESDDESEPKRAELLQKFSGQIEESTEDEKRTFNEALATLAGAQMEARRNRSERLEPQRCRASGPGSFVDTKSWVAPKKFESFTLDPSKARATGVTTDDLLPELSGGQPTPQPQQPEPSVPSTFDISAWAGDGTPRWAASNWNFKTARYAGA